jgi:hypothetical protein
LTVCKVHIGHGTMIGGTCGMGAKKGDRDITVSAYAFFREIASKDRCAYCVRIHFPHGGSIGYHGERSAETLDKED